MPHFLPNSRSRLNKAWNISSEPGPTPAPKTSASLLKPGSKHPMLRLYEVLGLGCITPWEEMKPTLGIFVAPSTIYIQSFNGTTLPCSLIFLYSKNVSIPLYKAKTTTTKPLVDHRFNINTFELTSHFRILRRLIYFFLKNSPWMHKHPPHPNMTLCIPAAWVYIQPFAELYRVCTVLQETTHF